MGLSKIVRVLPKIWHFLGKTICAPFCALFGQIRCAFEFRIIKHSAPRAHKQSLQHFLETLKFVTNQYLLLLVLIFHKSAIITQNPKLDLMQKIYASQIALFVHCILISIFKHYFRFLPMYYFCNSK